MSKKRRTLCFIFLALALFFCDASLKYAVHGNHAGLSHSSSHYPYGGVPVFQNFWGIDFCINYVTNDGGAWGIFSSYPLTLRAIRIFIILAGFFYVFWMNKERKRELPLLLILTGASANIFDCFLYGFVIDMFHFTLWGYSFPVFNIADMMIFFGVTILFSHTLFEKFNTKKKL